MFEIYHQIPAKDASVTSAPLWLVIVALNQVPPRMLQQVSEAAAAAAVVTKSSDDALFFPLDPEPSP